MIRTSLRHLWAYVACASLWSAPLLAETTDPTANLSACKEGLVVARVGEMKGDRGFNARTTAYEDLVEAGVIDPTKVVRCALQNAASIASLLLTTEAVIREIPAEKGKPAAGGGMPQEGGMY